MSHNNSRQVTRYRDVKVELNRCRNACISHSCDYIYANENCKWEFNEVFDQTELLLSPYCNFPRCLQYSYLTVMGDIVFFNAGREGRGILERGHTRSISTLIIHFRNIRLKSVVKSPCYKLECCAV